MIVGMQSLIETFKQFLQTLQISYLFPAASFIILSVFFYPDEIGIDAASLAMLSITMAIIFSNILFAFNGLIIRFVEGYMHKRWYLFPFFSWLFTISNWLEKQQYEKIIRKIEICKNKIEKIEDFIRNYQELERSEEFKLSEEFKSYIESNKNKLKAIYYKEKDQLDQLEIKRRLRFPSRKEDLLPTAFGNTISAFEEYPWERYKMDAVALYPRLLPILEKKRFLPFLQTQKTTLDFLLNTCIVSSLFCLEVFFWFLFYEPRLIYLGGWLFFLFFTFMLYQSTIFVARDWGIIVSTAFDLYRNDLRLTLFLKDLKDESLEEERKLWGAISNFINFAKTGDDFKGFVYSRSVQENT